MSKKITIDPSIATLLDIDPVGYEERVKITFTANENWIGAFTCIVYNSEAKNRFIDISTTLKVEGMVMNLLIEPKIQLLASAAYYYEIVSVGTKRLLFKGLLNIIK